MSIAALISRIDGAKSGIEKARGTLSEARGKTKPNEASPENKSNKITSEKPGEGISASDVGHTVLDVAGFIPGVGIAADLINAGWYAAEGDYVNAGLSAVGAIPLIGDTAAGVKMAGKGTDALINTVKAADGTRDADKAGDAARAAKGNSGKSGGAGSGQGRSGGDGNGGGNNGPTTSGTAEPPERRQPGLRNNLDGSPKSPTEQLDSIKKAADVGNTNRKEAMREGIDGEGTTTVDPEKMNKSERNVKNNLQSLRGKIPPKDDPIWEEYEDW